MFRSLLFAIGIFLLILGAQTLVVDRWIMTYSPVIEARDETGVFQQASFLGNRSNYYDRDGQPNVKRVYQTKEWMPWSLLAAGAIIVLYTYSYNGGQD